MFFKRKQKTPKELPHWYKTFLERERMVRVKISDWLQRRSARIPPMAFKVYIILTISILALVNGLLIWHAIAHPASISSIPWSPSPVMRTQRMPAPRGRGRSFYEMMDSIHRDTSLMRKWDSLLRVRPGLSDTLHQLYQLNP
ncbi:MAG: hypothetical protein P4L51_06140 [Puia sp.]|nr:hypothetical protein [Puia sp.]